MKQMARMAVESHGWPILEPIEVEGMSRPVAINKDVCVVGTRSEVNLKLRSPLVSRTHAMFVADRDAVYVRDLASRNHTFLNDKPIREAVLRDGDVIGVGPLTFRCKSGFDKPYDATEVHAPAAELRSADGRRRVPLDTKSTLIGSREDCDVVLRGKGVEPSHAIVFEREGRHFLRDLRTVSGTWVNDAAVGQIELNAGDEIRIADERFVYELAEAAEAMDEADAAHADALNPEVGDLETVSEDDEHVECELADETREAMPQSVGLSDWDAADLISEPQQGSASQAELQSAGVATTDSEAPAEPYENPNPFDGATRVTSPTVDGTRPQKEPLADGGEVAAANAASPDVSEQGDVSQKSWSQSAEEEAIVGPDGGAGGAGRGGRGRPPAARPPARSDHVGRGAGLLGSGASCR